MTIILNDKFFPFCRTNFTKCQLLFTKSIWNRDLNLHIWNRKLHIWNRNLRIWNRKLSLLGKRKRVVIL